MKIIHNQIRISFFGFGSQDTTSQYLLKSTCLILRERSQNSRCFGISSKE